MQLTLQADPGVPELTEVARELLERLGMSLSVRTVGELTRGEVAQNCRQIPPMLARIWVKTAVPRAVVYITDGACTHVFERDVPLSEWDEVAREQVAQIMQTAVEAIAAGGTIGVTREQFEQQVAQATVPPHRPGVVPAGHAQTTALRRPPPSRWVASLAARWGGQVIAPGPEATHRASVKGALRFPMAGLWGEVGAVFGYRFPSRLEGAVTDVDVEAMRAAIEVGAELPLSPSWMVGAVVGAELEHLWVQPRARQGSDVRPADATTAWVPLVSAALQVRKSVLAGLDLIGALGAELELVDVRFTVVEMDSTRLLAIRPWRVHPTAWLSAAFLL